MLKLFDFECVKCKACFEALVEGTTAPDTCPKCDNTIDFIRLIASPAIPTTIVVDYPGSKVRKAGYQHTHNRSAERKGSQVSMHIPRGRRV